MWYYKGKPVSESDIDPKAIGFIYVITTPEGRKYLGRKLLKSTRTKQVKGTKKKIKVDSDWKNYWSSSPELKALVAEKGTEGFKREIIYFAYSKGMMIYAEEKALYMLGVLESDRWINGNIRSKVFKNWVDLNTVHLLNEAIFTQSSSNSNSSSSEDNSAPQKGQ